MKSRRAEHRVAPGAPFGAENREWRISADALRVAVETEQAS